MAHLPGYHNMYNGSNQQQYQPPQHNAPYVRPNAGDYFGAPQQNHYPGFNPYSLGVAPPPPPPQEAYGHNPYLQGNSNYYPNIQSQQQQPPNRGGYSYDANVYAAASNLLNSRGNKPNNSQWQGKQQFQGRNKSFGKTTDSRQFFCEVCNVSCAGGVTYKEHLDGQKHKKKEELQKGDKTLSLAKNKLSYRCDLCGVTCTGQDTYNAHIRGAKHVKAAALCKKLGRPVPEDTPTILAPNENGITETKAKSQLHQQPIPGTRRMVGINFTKFVGGSKLNSTGQLEEKKKVVMAAVGSVGKPATIEVEDETLKAMMAAEEVEPVGEQFITEERDNTGKLVQYSCTLCECKFSDPNAKSVHLKGRRHRTAYKQKIDPTLVVDMKPSTKKARENSKFKQDSTSFGISTMPMRTGWFGSVATNALRLEVLDERTFQEKHNTLNPGLEFNKNVNEFFVDIKNTLKTVSEELEKSNTSEGQPSQSVLSGVAPAGTFAKDTYINGEDLFECVVTCNEIPTAELMKKVKESFALHSTKLTISEDSYSPVALLVSCSTIPGCNFRLYFTSPSVRNQDTFDDCPDMTTCKYGLALLRHTKWFDSHCRRLTSCQEVIRVLRDIRRNEPDWACLDDHRIELIVANLIDSSPVALPPSDAFNRILGGFSAGFAMTANLADPCEIGGPNVMDGCSAQQLQDLTASAGCMLRLGAFNQSYQFLKINRLHDIRPSLVSNDRKRKGDDEEVVENKEEPTENFEMKKPKVEEIEEANVKMEEIEEANVKREENVDAPMEENVDALKEEIEEV